MNYRWILMSFGVIFIGLYLYFLYKIPFTWIISILGLVWFVFGFVIKKHDTYSG